MIGERHKRIPKPINQATEIKRVNRYTPFRYMTHFFTLRKIVAMVLAQTIFDVSIVILAALPQAFAMLIDWFASAKSGALVAQ